MEIELKLALPGADAAQLAMRLGRLPLLARRPRQLQTLRNIYYDTPDQRLHAGQIALRVRSVKEASKLSWRQTLKIGSPDSALSQRGEWEAPLPNARLSKLALADTPWQEIDPDGSVFGALAPRFQTAFERTRWIVRRRDRSEVEVALDIGWIIVDGRTSPLCELEIELRAGPPSVLFEIAAQIAKDIAVLPLNASKAERGYALADGSQDRARRAKPGGAAKKLALPELVRLVLRENFGQFSANLEQMRHASAPELAHQARVGWRRFRSSLRLFRPFISGAVPPSGQPLRALLTALGSLRDLDVARTQTLPPLAHGFAAGSPTRAKRWDTMLATLDEQAGARLEAVRAALADPAVGSCLLATTEWLELAPMGSLSQNLPGSPDDGASTPATKRWSAHRLARLHRRMADAALEGTNPERQHQARILAKRLRYGVEELRSLLPKRKAERWHDLASSVQSGIGAERDLAQALELVTSLSLDPGVADYLLGVATARQVATSQEKPVVR